MPDQLRIGVDLGGTKISAIAFDHRDQVIAHIRTDTPKQDYEASVACIAGLVSQIIEQHGPGTVGIGIPGSVSPRTGMIQNGNSTWLNGRDLPADLPAAIGQPVRLANDANCFALSEAIDGSGSDAATVFGVIIGTGCGGGIVINRQPLIGPHNIGGEWGHNPLPWPHPDEHPGLTCWCGRSNCIETWVSGTGLENDHERVTGTRLGGKDISSAAAAGDPAARDSLARHAGRLARGLAHVVNLIDPDVIILGGGLSNLKTLYTALPDLIRPHVFADEWSIEVRPPKHGDDSGVRGAARLWTHSA